MNSYVFARPSSIDLLNYYTRDTISNILLVIVTITNS